MTLERLQRLNFSKRLSFSLIVIIIAFIIFVEVIDRSIIHLTLFDYRIQFSFSISLIFVIITSSEVVVQSIFFPKIYSNKLTVRKAKLRILYLVPLVCHFVNILLVAILMMQIILDARYHKLLILFTIWINVSVGISILAALAYRLILWLKESSKKNIVVIFMWDLFPFLHF